IDENDDRRKKKRKITPNTTVDTSTLLEAKEIELLLEEKPEQDQNMLENPGATIIMETQSKTNNLYKKNNITMEIDNNIPLKQPIDNYQKYAHNNPYAVLGQQEISQNKTQNLEQLNEDNEED
ncbi:29393_t:CDS:2, partial [Gigaspora margarita]